ncbi:MAG: aldo/keto reductase family protein [candidate division Zixibacteria bacterium]|nr:aldo/keto reductase family protein [candidate division Zixibacteria bacterium]
MKYRRIGKSGLKVSEIALGAWLTYGRSVEDKLSESIIHKAVESGVNFIDIADAYAGGSAEKAVGQAIKVFKRSDLVISTKLFWPMSDNVNDRGLSRKHIMESIDKSLKRIGTDYVDIYFCHRYDEETEVEETVRAMDDLIRQGKILYWGTSVWEADQIQKANDIAQKFGAYAPIVEQPQYNMLDRHIETKIMPACSSNGMGFTVWSPLAGGILTGKYVDGIPKGSRADTTQFVTDELTAENRSKVIDLLALARTHDLTLAQLALAWVLKREEISCAIIGATSLKQLEENLKAKDVELGADLVAEINVILDSKA